MIDSRKLEYIIEGELACMVCFGVDAAPLLHTSYRFNDGRTYSSHEVAWSAVRSCEMNRIHVDLGIKMVLAFARGTQFGPASIMTNPYSRERSTRRNKACIRRAGYTHKGP